MAQTKKPLIVWLYPGAAKQFLGLEAEPGKEHPNRFHLVGTMTAGAMAEGAPAAIGFWMDIESIKERTVPGNYVVNQWTVEPKRCLVRWDVVSLIQEGDDEGVVGAVQVVLPAAA